MHVRHPWWNIAIGAGALVPVAIVARADMYLSQEQAAHLIFPGVLLSQKTIAITTEQRVLTVFVGPHKEAVFIDQVLGKHEFITMAVGIAPDGVVQGVEILEYRETYGAQITNADWRKQFVGKNTHSPLRVGTDIKNISGATLSSAHVTAGVRRLVQTYALVRSSL